RYYNSLGDRIVAGYPRDEAAEFEKKLGYHDDLLDCGEIFHFLVLEGSKEILDRLAFEKCALHVVVTDDQTPYRTRKVRFLNGAHTGNVLAAIQGGVTFVDEMMDDPVFGKMTRKMIYDEIFPTVKLPDEEKKFFADSIVERFQNPFAHHRLLSIALNSVSKWRVRVLPSLLDFTQMKGELPACLAFSLAALLAFYRGKYPADDSPEVLSFFKEAQAQSTGDFVRSALGKVDFWAMDLNTVPGLTDFVTKKLALIESKGIRFAAESVL
ncbi:MAG: hypothetical protein PHS41_09960, partial [Victivallaceae bacterium]|nr:hypothetical protein [Victivallaceae bacterium]